MVIMWLWSQYVWVPIVVLDSNENFRHFEISGSFEAKLVPKDVMLSLDTYKLSTLRGC
jgi:hypothetical protein